MEPAIPFNVDVSRLDDALIVAPEGEIDIATAVDLEGNFAAPLRLPDRSGETWVVQAEYLGAIGFGNCAGPRVRVVT